VGPGHETAVKSPYHTMHVNRLLRTNIYKLLKEFDSTQADVIVIYRQNDKQSSASIIQHYLITMPYLLTMPYLIIMPYLITTPYTITYYAILDLKYVNK